MEKRGERSRESVANTKGCRGFTQHKINEYDDDSRLYVKTERDHTRESARTHGGSGTGGVHKTDHREPERDHGNGLVGNGERCKLLVGFKKGYSCAHCIGGRDYGICCNIRKQGLKK